MGFGSGGGGAASIGTSTDVALSNPANNQVLTYDSGVGKWVNAATSVTLSGVVSGPSGTTVFANGASAPADTSNGGGEVYFNAGNSGSAITLSLANGNVQRVVLTANATLTLTSPASNSFRSLLLLIVQDATGSRTMTWPASVRWGTPGAPTLSTTGNATDIVNLFTVNGGTTWYASAGVKGY